MPSVYFPFKALCGDVTIDLCDGVVFGWTCIQGSAARQSFGPVLVPAATDDPRCDTRRVVREPAPPSSGACPTQRHICQSAICYLSFRPSLRRGRLVARLMQNVVIEGALKMRSDLSFRGYFGAKHFFNLGCDPVGIA